MSWGAQNRSKDAKTPSAGRGMSEKPELDCRPVQPYVRAPDWALIKHPAIVAPASTSFANPAFLLPAVVLASALRGIQSPAGEKTEISLL